MENKNALANDLFVFFHFSSEVWLKFLFWVLKLMFLKPNLIKYIFVKRFSDLLKKNKKQLVTNLITFVFPFLIQYNINFYLDSLLKTITTEFKIHSLTFLCQMIIFFCFFFKRKLILLSFKIGFKMVSKLTQLFSSN